MYFYITKEFKKIAILLYSEILVEEYWNLLGEYSAILAENRLHLETN